MQQPVCPQWNWQAREEFVTWRADFFVPHKGGWLLAQPVHIIFVTSSLTSYSSMKSNRVSHSMGSFSKDSLSPCRAAHPHLQRALLGRTFPRETVSFSLREASKGLLAGGGAVQPSVQGHTRVSLSFPSRAAWAGVPPQAAAALPVLALSRRGWRGALLPDYIRLRRLNVLLQQ